MKKLKQMKNRMSLLPKILGVLLALLIVSPLSSAVAATDSYPNTVVRFIVPFPPGGATDVIARRIAAKLSERLGKQVIVDNHGGAGGIIGTEMVANTAPDGYTLLFTQPSFTVLPSLQKMSFDPIKSFTPIMRLASGPNALVVNPSVPANSVKELISLAKQKPGWLIFASTGVGNDVHVGTELFKMMADDIDIKIVHFKGGGPATIDLLGGHSHAYFGALMQTLSYIKSGKVKVLGTGGLKRNVQLPNVPTIAETLPGFELGQWWGILAPAGTPKPVVDRLNKELKTILTSDETEKWLLTQGVDVDCMGPTEFGRFIAEDLTKWSRVIKKANIKLE